MQILYIVVAFFLNIRGKKQHFRPDSFFSNSSVDLKSDYLPEVTSAGNRIVGLRQFVAVQSGKIDESGIFIQMQRRF
jgi:hypothetical protein